MAIVSRRKTLINEEKVEKDCHDWDGEEQTVWKIRQSSIHKMNYSVCSYLFGLVIYCSHKLNSSNCVVSNGIWLKKLSTPKLLWSHSAVLWYKFLLFSYQPFCFPFECHPITLWKTYIRSLCNLIYKFVSSYSLII